MFSPHKTPRRSHLQTSSSLTRSPLVSVSGGRRQPNIGSVGPSKPPVVKEQALLETPDHSVQLYGSTLPVLVKEVLNTAKGNVSVRLDSSGWACLVTWQRLLLWRYVDTQHRVSLARELSLPTSETRYTADMVCVLPEESTTSSRSFRSLSVVVASPQGVLRLWPNALHESSSTETALELASGHQCIAITAVTGSTCVVATFQGDLFLVNVTRPVGQVLLSWQPLHAHEGTLAGFRRRVSSLFFNPTPASSTSRDVRRLLSAVLNDEAEERAMVVMGSSSIQLWLSPAISEKMFTIDVNSFQVRQSVAEELSAADPDIAILIDGLRVNCLDAQITPNAIILLAEVLNSSTEASQLHPSLFLVYFGCGDNDIGQVKRITKLSDSLIKAMQTSSPCRPQLVHIPATSLTYLCLPDIVYPIADEVVSDKDHFELVDLSHLSDQDIVCSAAHLNGQLLLFWGNTGLLTISPKGPRPASAKPSVAPGTNVPTILPSVEDTDGGSLTSVSSTGPGDVYSRLRSTFLHFCHTADETLCQGACKQLFPVITAELNSLLVRLSEELANDPAISDPRWVERDAMSSDPRSTAALLSIQHALQNKEKVHKLLLQFLISVGWWEQLGTIVEEDRAVSTVLVIGEHAEKLAAAGALIEMHLQYPAVLDATLQRVLQHRVDSMSQQSASSQHRFYQEVVAIGEVIPAVVEYEEEHLHSLSCEDDINSLLLPVNAIIEVFLSAALRCRRTNLAIFYPKDVLARVEMMEYHPWTASPFDNGLRAALLRQFQLTVSKGLSLTDKSSLRQQLFSQLYHLADFILDGYNTQLESARQQPSLAARRDELQQEMEGVRHDVLQPFMTLNEHERAQQLAEKYADFSALLNLCQTSGDDQRLHTYVSRFQEKGFADFMFKAYMDRGQRAKLFRQPQSLQPQVTSFLEAYPQYSWLQSIVMGNFTQACQTLEELSRTEYASLSRKKTLLSLAKLSLLASDDAGNKELLKAICNKQEIILHQEDLVHSSVPDAEYSIPLSPEKLMLALVKQKNADSFVQAFEVLQLVEMSEDELEANRVRILSHAILSEREFWLDVEETERQERIAATVYCQVVQAVARSGDSLLSALPSADSLLASPHLDELELSLRPAVQFWIRAVLQSVLQSTS